MKYHCHIYQLAMKIELNLTAESEEEAKNLAIKLARKGVGKIMIPETGAIAIAFQQEEDISR